MALTDPLAITIGGVAYSLSRTVTEPRKATYVDPTGLVREVPSQVANGRLSHVMTLGVSKIAPDPISAVNKQIAASLQVSFIRPLVGFSTTELVNMYVGLNTQLTASTNALLIKLINGES